MVPLNLLAAVAPSGDVGFTDIIKFISDASPAVMLTVILLALWKKWLIFPRELDRCEKRIEELQKEKNEYKDLLFKAINIGEKAASVAEEHAR